MELIARYGALPQALLAFAQTQPMRRLQSVGMNCGCEYTACPIYKARPQYTRYQHSLGAAAIVWHFTQDAAQSLSALFHDIATPVFAHVVDFLNGDHLVQESTEAPTHAILAGDEQIQALLRALRLTTADVDDYHRYPIADNDSPRLSSDRLEYTLGNAYRMFDVGLDEISAVYDNLCIARAEDGAPELSFRDLDAAQADLLRFAIRMGVLTRGELWKTEPEIIAKLESRDETRAYWHQYRKIAGTHAGKTPPDGVYAVRVRAKKRHINPLVLTQKGPRRQAALDAGFAAQLQEFLRDDFDRFVWAEFAK